MWLSSCLFLVSTRSYQSEVTRFTFLAGHHLFNVHCKIIPYFKLFCILCIASAVLGIGVQKNWTNETLCFLQYNLVPLCRYWIISSYQWSNFDKMTYGDSSWMNYSYEMVLFRESNPSSTASVLRFLNKWHLMSQFSSVNQNHTAQNVSSDSQVNELTI